jgi:hypothetical protein
VALLQTGPVSCSWVFYITHVCPASVQVQVVHIFTDDSFGFISPPSPCPKSSRPCGSVNRTYNALVVHADAQHDQPQLLQLRRLVLTRQCQKPPQPVLREHRVQCRQRLAFRLRVHQRVLHARRRRHVAKHLCKQDTHPSQSSPSSVLRLSRHARHTLAASHPSHQHHTPAARQLSCA